MKRSTMIIMLVIVLVLFVFISDLDYLQQRREAQYNRHLANINQILVEQGKVNNQIKKKVKEIVSYNKEIFYVAIWNNTSANKTGLEFDKALYHYPENISIKNVPHGTKGTYTKDFRIVVGLHDSKD